MAEAEEIHQGLLARVEGVPRRLVHRAVGKVKHTYGVLVQRYGPGYARAIVGAGLVGLPVPIPLSSALTAAPVLAAAEVHRALAGRNIVSAAVSGLTLTAEHIQSLGKHWLEELLHGFAEATDHPGEYEALVHQAESAAGRTLTEEEQWELLAKYLEDVI
jgi:hypothetical protein